MASFARELLAVDRQRLDLKAGPLGLAVLSVLGLAISFVGTDGDGDGDRRSRRPRARSSPAGRSWTTAVLPLVLEAPS